MNLFHLPFFLKKVNAKSSSDDSKAGPRPDNPEHVPTLELNHCVVFSLIGFCQITRQTHQFHIFQLLLSWQDIYTVIYFLLINDPELMPGCLGSKQVSIESLY